MTKKIDHPSIARKIDAIPSICSDGKKAVASLLQEFGYKPPDKRKPKKGEVWWAEDSDDTNGYMLIVQATNKEVVLLPIGEANSYGVCTFTPDEVETAFITFDHTYDDLQRYINDHA